MRKLALVLFVSGIAATVAWAQEDYSKVQIKTTKVAEGVYMLEGAGGNIGVSVGEDGVLIIDDQFAPLTPKIKAAIAALTPKPIKFVLNTHWHGDHVGGNENLGKEGTVIVAHENVRKRMSVEQFIKRFGRKVPPSPKAALPVVTFTRDVTFHWNGDDIEVTWIGPAHTDGDALVRFKKANVLHMGDVFVTTSFPFVDTSSGGHYDGFITAAEKVLATVDEKTKIIPGHGALSDRAGLSAWKNMLATIRDRVQKGVAAKKTLAQIQASKPTREWDAKLGKGWIKANDIVELVYQAVTAPK